MKTPRKPYKKAPPGKDLMLPGSIRMAQALLALDRAQKADNIQDDQEITITKDSFSLSMNPMRDVRGDVAIRQGTDDDDPFEQGLYADGLLIPPIWNPWTLYRIFEESDILQAYIRFLVDGLCRPTELEYCGPKKEVNSKETERQEIKARDFLSKVNETHSWYTMHRQRHLDQWVAGNGFVEVLADRKSFEPLLAYNTPPTFMRVSTLDIEPILTWGLLPRDGELKEFPIYRKFRRFARWLPTKKIEWFKQIGDPRVMNKITGHYVKDGKGQYILEKDLKPEDYSEIRGNAIWWFRDVYGGMVYGVPRWCAAMGDIRGNYLSRWCNFDVIDHGGIPPWLLLVYGKLSPGTRKYLKDVIKKWRDPNAYSDPGVLEIEPNLLSFNSSGGAKAGAEFVSMRDMRNEDSMFNKYSETCWQNVGRIFRLAGVLEGKLTEAALDAIETNVLGPLRAVDDERYNVEFLQPQLGIYLWRIKTKRPPLSGDSLYKALGMAGRTGGPSLNDLTRVENEVFGTQWPERDHWFYSKVSAAEAIGMVRAGQVTYDKDTGDPIVLPPATMQDEATLAKDNAGVKLASDDEGKLDKLMPVADAINLLQAFRRLEAEAKGYQATDNPDPNFKM